MSDEQSLQELPFFDDEMTGPEERTTVPVQLARIEHLPPYEEAVLPEALDDAEPGTEVMETAVSPILPPREFRYPEVNVIIVHGREPSDPIDIQRPAHSQDEELGPRRPLLAEDEAEFFECACRRNSLSSPRHKIAKLDDGKAAEPDDDDKMEN